MEDLQAAERLHQYARFQGWLDEEQNKYLTDSLTNLRNRVGLSRGDRPAEAPHSPQPIVPPTETGQSRQHSPAEPTAPVQPIILPTSIFPNVSPASYSVGEISKAVTAANQPTSVTSPPAEASLNAGFDLPRAKLGGGGNGAAVTGHALDLNSELDGKESGRGLPLHNVLRSFMERSNIVGWNSSVHRWWWSVRLDWSSAYGARCPERVASFHRLCSWWRRWPCMGQGSTRSVVGSSAQHRAASCILA